MKNIEELLSIITKGMSEKDIELTHVDLYERAVGINNKVKVCIGNHWLLVHKVDRGGGFTFYSTDSMLDKVLELLTEDDWLPGDDIENDLEWCTLVVENDCYRLLYNDYSISDRMTLNYLKSNYTNASLEKRMKQ
ncbi:hypothetical protein LCFBJUUZ_CDS0140 [Staphylococcus phage PG-2021_76]